MTTYAEFKEFYLRRIWRTGDADLEQDFDQLVAAAEEMINKDFRDRNLTVTTSDTLDSAEYDLPADCQEIIVLWLEGQPYSTPTTLQMFRNRYHFRTNRRYGASSSPLPDKQATGYKGQYYALEGQKVHIVTKASVENPETINITYYQGAPSYKDDPANPFYDRHQTIYLAALDIHVYNYMREFALRDQKRADYADALDRMERDQAMRDMPSGPIDAPLPGVVM